MNNILNRVTKNSKNAFSLAEMLLVLLILSFLIVSLAPIAYKKIPKKTDRLPHGRFECYYDGEKLMQYTADEIYGETTPKEVTKCEFTPPVKASFFIIQAIGGGAGGTYITEDPNSTTPIYESGTIKSPTTSNSLSGTYTQSNCIISDTGDAGNGGDAEGSCPTWLKDIWNTQPPTVTLSACAAGGDGGVGTAKKYENGDINRSRGGDGGDGDCTEFTTRAPMDMTFEYSGSKSGGNVTLKYPDGSCLLGGGTNGSDSSDPLVNGTSGSTGTSTCTPITGSTSGGSGREGCFTNESCPRYSGSSGSFSLPDVSYKRQGTKAATRYGYMGNTGEYQSMFFPGISEALDITVGKGGTPGTSIASPAGGDGGDTLIKIKNASMSEAIRAKGGKGNSLGGSYSFWLKGGAPTDQGAVDADARFAVASGFSTFIELDEDSKMPSKITGTMTGMGGDGAYSIVRNTDSIEQIHINGVFVTNEEYHSVNKSQAYQCIDKRGNVLKTISGTESVCPAQPGNSGAVVIVW